MTQTGNNCANGLGKLLNTVSDGNNGYDGKACIVNPPGYINFPNGNLQNGYDGRRYIKNPFDNNSKVTVYVTAECDSFGKCKNYKFFGNAGLTDPISFNGRTKCDTIQTYCESPKVKTTDESSYKFCYSLNNGTINYNSGVYASGCPNGCEPDINRYFCK